MAVDTASHLRAISATPQQVPPLLPPFYVDYYRMANESRSLANKTYCVTGEMRNEIILLPIFLLLLYSLEEFIASCSASKDSNVSARLPDAQKDILTFHD